MRQLAETNKDLIDLQKDMKKAKEVADAAKGVLLSHWFKRAKVAGGWLTCIPNRLNGTKLSAEEFRDNLRLCFGLKPSGLPKLCDTHSTARREGCS